MKRPHDSTSRPSTEPGSILERDSDMLIKARIRGLETVDECREWIEYELEEEPAGDVRKGVIALLNTRMATLESCSPG